MNEGAPKNKPGTTRRDALRILGGGIAAGLVSSVPAFGESAPAIVRSESSINNGDMVERGMSHEAHRAYQEGVMELREAALTLPYEEMRTFVANPDGTYRWIKPSWEETSGISTPGFFTATIRPDAQYDQQVQIEFDNGSLIEYMHTHPTDSNGDKALPPSPMDIRHLVQVTASMQDEADMQRYTFTAVAGDGTWRYSLSSKQAAGRLNKVFVSAVNAISSLPEEHRDEAIAFNEYFRDLSELLENASGTSPQLKHYYAEKERTAEERAAHPEDFHTDLIELGSLGDLGQLKAKYNTRKPMTPKASIFFDRLAGIYQQAQDALHVISPRLARDPLRAPLFGIDEEYVKAWMVLGVRLTFTPFKE